MDNQIPYSPFNNMHSNSLDFNAMVPLIRQEFETLNPSHRPHNRELHRFASALLPDNAHKNRYYNILPNEESRVRLTPVEGEGDYINANYIDGEVLNSKRAYILTQAPLPSTVNDFWRMIWENKTPVIVCLTKLEDDHRQRAHKYWPEEGSSQVFGKICVYPTLRILFKGITVRSFTIWKEDNPLNAIEVIHLHYPDWPDFEAPGCTASIRTLSSLLTALKERGRTRNVTGPAVVHCSAGVGRAGTFVSIHITLNKLERLIFSRGPIPSSLFEYPFTIKETVSRLRKQRAGIVQTMEQYIFIYRVIADSLHQESRRKNLRKSLELPINKDKEEAPKGKESSSLSSLSLSSPSTSTPVSTSNNGDKVNVSAFLDILSLRPTKCSEATQELSSSNSKVSIWNKVE